MFYSRHQASQLDDITLIMNTNERSKDKEENIDLEFTCKLGMLGYEVNKPSKKLIKISNVAEYIISDIQNIKASKTDDPIISYV